MRLLHIDSSISGEQSVSRQLTASIVAHLKQNTPDLEITYRDIAAAPIPHLSPALQRRKLQALSGDEALDADTTPLQGSDTSSDDALEQDFATINTVLNEFPRSRHHCARCSDVQLRYSKPAQGMDRLLYRSRTNLPLHGAGRRGSLCG